jgi:Ca2+-binding RTX toxin-like protein
MSPWSVKRRGRRNFARAAVVVAMSAALVGVVSSAQADANSDAANGIADGLRSFADRLDDSADALGEYQALAESLPLVDLAPGSQEALRLSTLLQEQLTAGSKALDASYNTLGELESDLEGLDELQDGVQFTVGDVNISGSPGGVITVVVPISATRHVDQKLDFQAGIASIDGGSVGIDFALSSTLTFQLDTSGGAPFPATAFSLVVPAGAAPTIDLCANVDAAIASFTARLGFTDVTLSTNDPGTPEVDKAKLKACAKVTFSDPDSNGVLTKDEFTSSALTEIAEAALVDGDPAGNDLDAKFFLDASLVPGNPDATITITDLNLAALPAPNINPLFGNLADFTSITPGEVVNGLTQFIASFGGSQIAGNGGIPFVEDGLSRAFEVVKPLKDYARRLTDAEVVCGTEPGTTTKMPTGSTANLTDDTFVYCRAKTAYTVSAGLTTWTSPEDAIEKTSGAAADATIGSAPEQNAKFQMNGAGSFDVSVAFTADPDAGGPQLAQSFTAIPRPQTAQELFDDIAAAAGLDTGTSGLTYDPMTKSLAYRLKGSFNPDAVGPSAENPPTWDFGDQLRNVTHLAGLKASATATTTLDAGQVNWDATFGVILTATEADITPATGSPSLLDRFFVKVRTAPGEHEISLDDLSVTGNVQLDGQVGFLGVHASGSGTDNTFQNGTAFGVSKFDPAKPVLSVDINPGSGVVLDTDPGPGESLQTIAGAISVGELAFNLDDAHLDAVCNLKATAGLHVSADVAGGLQTLAEAGVAVNWPQVFQAGSCEPDRTKLQITPSASFNTDLFHFDPFPSVSGKATAVAANPNEGVVLIDGTKNPTPGDGNDATEFPALGNFTNLTLRNKTTGATCIILSISAQELTCATSLSGGTRQGDLDNNNKWKIGDEYEVEGNALGMLSIILDNLDKLVDQLEALGADVDATIPLINMSTKDLVAKIQSIKRTIDDLRGFPKAQIQCDLDNNFSTTEDVSVLDDGTTVYCRATTQNTPTAVQWKVKADAGGTATIAVNGESGLDPAIADEPAALTTVGPTPSTSVQFTVNDGDPVADKTTLDEWQLSLEWSDAGGSNTAEFPPLSPPGTLQQLEELIEEKLGIADPNVFALDLRDLPTPGVGPVATGTADNSSTGSTLHDTGNLTGVIVGMTAIRTTNPGKGDRCSITSVSGNDAVTCNIAGGWDNMQGYQIVGNGTKDLVIKLGAGFCGEAGGLTCDDTYRKTDPLSVPLNLEVGALGDLVSVDSANELDLGYKARATLEVGIPLKLGIPVPTIVDTTGLELEGRAAVDPINLSAGIGPIKVNIGAAIADKDPADGDPVPGEGTAKVGAQFTFKRGDDDGIPSNRTYDFAGGNSFFTSGGGLAATFEGVDQDCGGSTSGGMNDDACLVADLGISPTPAFLGDIVLSCDIQPLPAAPTCAAPGGSAIAALQAAIDGDPLNFALLIQLLPQLLNDLEHSLSGAAQDVEIPLVGEALDAGAGIVNTFNQGVVIPFANLAAEINAAADTDTDGTVEPAEVAAKVQQAIFDLIGPSGSVQLGGQPANLIQDLNGSGGPATIDDVSVVALCGDPADRCADGDAVTAIDDFRITVKIGQSIDKNVPFDLGLDGVPLSLQGGLHAGGGWSLLLDFGLSRDGPYLVKSGPQSVTGPLDGVTGTENEVNMPFNADGPDDDPPEGPDGELPNDAWAPVPYLEDDDATFTGKVEIGSWLKNVTQGTSCRITKVENTKLYCDNFVGAAGIMWTQTGATAGDVYEIVALHAPDEGQPGGAPELNLTAELGFGQAPAGTCASDPDDLPGTPEGLEGLFSVDGTDPGQGKCLQAKVAFLTATVRDKISGDSCMVNRAGLSTGEDPTTLCLTAFLDVTSSGSDPRITLANLGQASLTLGFTGDANVDIRFRTGIGSGPDFPSVVGKFHLYWGFSGSTETAPSASSLLITFDGLHLDAGAFIGRFLGPIVKDIQNITKPLQPVIETLQAEVPIVSDLSKLVGEGPVTMLDLLEAISGNDLSLVRSVLQLVRFINALPTDSAGLLIPLGNSPGSFTVDNTRAQGPQPTPDQAGKGITGADAGKNLTNQLGGLGATAPADECEGRGSTFGVCGLTFPFLADASQIFGVLMGQDVTLVRYDAGTLKAGAGFGYCFPPILIGPVPVEICIGGSFEVAGRFAMGYDTSGIRKLLEGGSGTALLDGIFIDDYNAAGEEVPEISFTGTVYAEGAVTVAIISVGVRGEIIFTTNLDLDDRPNPDGKLRIEEIINRLSNPICLFVVSGQIDASLSAFVEIDLFFFTKRFSIEIVRITLLKFEVKCEPEVPNLADVLDGPDAGTTPDDRLILNVGNTGTGETQRRDDRNIQESNENENLVVRQMEDVTSGANAGKTRFSIAGFGIKEDEYLDTVAVHAGTAVVEAHGHNGDDSFSFIAGGGNEGTANTPDDPSTPGVDESQVDLKEFEPKVDADGDDGDDEITSGLGNDDITGGANNDKLITGPGVDTIDGGTGDDNIDAGPGNDVNVLGGFGNDTMNGGPGGDTMQGQAGDDNMSAGPDDPAATFTDTLIGNNGNDTIAGDGGVDNLFGDDQNSDCDEADETADPAGDNTDAITGGAGNDNIYGGPERDQLEGQQGDDTICGNGGGDEILGGTGDDGVTGGTGDDNITGGTDPLSGPGSDPVTEGDTLRGGSGRDYMLGDDGTLTRDGSNNVAHVLATTFDENDTMHGGPDDDFMWGQGGVDTMNGNENDDEMRGGNGADTMNGDADDDEMYGDNDPDAMHGNGGNDYMRGGVGIDTMDGDDDTDEMYGDNDADIMRGGGADDLMRGGSGADEIEGNANSSSALPLDVPANPLAAANFDLDLNEGAGNVWTASGGGDGDVIYGDADQDDIIGGSQGTPAAADDGDTIFGNAAQDVVLGDDGDISRPGGNDPDGTTTRTVSLRNPGTDGGGDYIQGNEENDDIYAGGAGDLVHGDVGDDYIEGNGGSDGDPTGDHLPVAAIGLYGDAGQDDMIGGTSQGTGGVADGADDIWGGQGADVATGDNADVTRAAGGDCPAEPNGSAGYDCNTFRLDAADVVIRRIQLSDVATTDAGVPAGSFGGDTIGGQDGHDRLYGQGGDDWIEGGGNDDFVFGNADVDTIFGGDGQDDLVGGTGRTDSADQASATDGRLDAGDIIHGEGDFDAIAGDNSRMVRQTQDGDTGPNADSTGLWKANTFNSAVDRLIALMDVGVVSSPAAAGTSGNDQLLGGPADDVVYGQGGNDGISGGDDQDVLEGNANGTGNAPDPAGTYGGAWPTFAGDVIHGDAGADDIAGGTAWIYRMVGGVETADPVAGAIRVGTDGRLDGADTAFGDGGGDAIAGDNTVIERVLTGAGAWVLDDLHAPDALGVVRRITRERDVATVSDLAPLGNGTSGGDVLYGNDGVDVAYGQGGEDSIQGNGGDDHLEGNEGDDTIAGSEGRDDVVGGTGRTFSNDESTAMPGRIDNPVGDDALNDTLHGGDGVGGVATDDDDVVVGDNGTVDRLLGALPAPGNAELGRLPFNGTWGEATWDEPNILRVIRLLDVSKTGATASETNGTNGEDMINGEASEDVLFGGGGADTITGDDGDDYIEGNGAIDTIRGDLGQDDITGGGSAVQDGTANSALDANRDGTLDPGRLGETLRDDGDLIAGDSGDAVVGDSDVIAGDNARIQRPLAVGSGDWRTDANRVAVLRDVQLFDLEKVGGAEGKSADAGESGVDSIFGNGGPDIAFGQGNGSAPVVYGTETGNGTCQNMGANGPGSGPAFSPTGDDDNDDLPDLSDPDCRAAVAPGDKIEGQAGGDYLEGNQGSDYITGGDGEDDVIGGSSSNDGHIAAIRAKDERPAGDLPTGFAPPPPSNLLDGHDHLQGNADDDTVVGDNAFVDRYLSGASGTWITISGPGRPADPNQDFKHPEEAAYGPYPGQIRRDVTMQQTPESDGAYGDDLITGGTENDDLYGQRGNDWIEGNEGEDAIVGDLGKILDNLLGGPGVGDEVPDPPLDQYIRPNSPFLDDDINRTGVLKREVELYSFDITKPNPATGHDTALGGSGNDWIHTGPGEDVANGNSGDDRIFLGDSKAGAIVKLDAQKIAHDFVDVGWGGQDHDHIYGGYGADFLDVRPRTTQAAPGIVPGADPATWFQVAGMVTATPGQTGDVYGDFSGIDFIYGGWDQDAMQANRGDNGPKAGDRLMDWSGSYNIYYLCPATYGDFVTTRQIAPGLIAFLQSLSFGDGSLNPTTPGTSGFRDTAIVFSNEAKFNANPVHPDTPGHFNTACDP